MSSTLPKIPHDYHMHSNFSPDCQAPMADMCRGAVAAGVAEIGFTEHYDLHPDEPKRDWFRPEPWWISIEECRAEFSPHLTIRAGIEIGEPHLFPREVQAILDRCPFDYVLGSLHWVGKHNIFNPNYFRQFPAAETYPAFFEELARMTQVGGFDILSHFDVPVRKAYAIYGGYDPKPYEELIRLVLQNCVEQGIALDLNTSALRSHAGILTPGLEILRWYVEMGGERITLGSDAHRPHHVGNHLDVALEAAQQAGVKYLVRFKQRQPHFVAIQ